jgi:phosphoribosylamine--glycine ligase
MAKIVLCSKDGYGAWFSLRLLEEGHSVTYYLKDQKKDCVLGGLCPEPMDKAPDFTKYDLAIFDVTGMPKLAEQASLLCPVIGDGNLQSEIEDNRLLGIQVMEEAGINVPPYEAFDNINTAKRFVRKTNKAYVFKPYTPKGGKEQDTATTYVAKSADDLLDYLDKLSGLSGGVEFILQEVVQGTEISTEGYFNGEDFFFVNGTLEEKKFMNDRKGPNTGCAGNLVWAYDQDNLPWVFREGLGKMRDFLQQYKFKGMIDLNTIVNATQLFGLEWTPRFGYDATATLFGLVTSNLGDFLGEIASGVRPVYDFNGGYAVGVRLSIPPYPTEKPGLAKEGIPVKGICEEDAVRGCYLYDVCCVKGELVTAGVNGLVAVPLSVGDDVRQAFARCYGKVDKIHVPDMQYRTDLECCITERYNTLASQGWLR